MAGLLVIGEIYELSHISPAACFKHPLHLLLQVEDLAGNHNSIIHHKPGSTNLLLDSG